MSPSVPGLWTAMGPQALCGGNRSGVEVGAVERAGAGSGPVATDWNVVAAVARVDKETGLVLGNGPGC